MIIDSLNEYSDAQAVTGGAPSTNTIDHGVAGETIGNELYLHVHTDAEDFATLVGLTVSLQTSDTEGFIAATTLWTSPQILAADLTANTLLARVRVPAGRLRYTRMSYAVAGSNATAGAINAFLSPSVQDQSTIG